MNSRILMDQLLVSCPHRRDLSVIVFFFSIDGSDYVNDGPKTLVFNSSFTSLSIPLQIVNDSIFEVPEMLQASLRFMGVPPERVILSPNIANITILDDDQSQSESSLKVMFPPRIAFSSCIVNRSAV